MVLGLHPRFRVALLPLLFLQKAWLENDASMSVAQVMTCNVQRLLRLPLTKRRTWRTSNKQIAKETYKLHKPFIMETFLIQLGSILLPYGGDLSACAFSWIAHCKYLGANTALPTTTATRSSDKGYKTLTKT